MQNRKCKMQNAKYVGLLRPFILHFAFCIIYFTFTF